MIEVSSDSEAAPTTRRSFLVTVLRPKVAVPAILLAILIGGPFAYRASRLVGLPDPGEPFDLAKYGTVTIAPGEDAFGDYDSAHGLLIRPSDEVDVEITRVLEQGWETASPEVRDWLDVNRPTLKHWKDGTERADFVEIQPAYATIETQLTLTSDLRQFVRLGQLEAARLESLGELDAAWAMLRAAFRCSRHSGKNGLIIERLVGVAAHAMAVRGIEMWARNPALSAEQLQAALHELEADYRMTPPISANLRVEYFVMRDVLDRTGADDLLNPRGSANSWELTLQRAIIWGANEPEFSRRVIRQFFWTFLELIDKPRSERPWNSSSGKSLPFDSSAPKSLAPNRLPAEHVSEFLDRSIIARMLLPSVGQFDQAVGNEQARQNALIVALALHVHHRRHGMYPSTLNRLIEDGILEQLPTDPFGGASESMRYRLESEQFILWSVGTNGLDDGGQVSETSPGLLDVGLIVPLGSKPAIAELPQAQM